LPPRNSFEALYLISWPLFGALSGSVFSLVFAVAERRRGFDELSARRTTLWGTVGGSTVPVGFIILTRATPGLDLAPMAPTIFAIMAMLGAACGVGMLFLARHGRAPVDVSAPPT
jgi:hypothetical protein